MPVFGNYADRRQAIDLLTQLYVGIDLSDAPPVSCEECCAVSTPVCSYIEAEYVRENLHRLDRERWQAALDRCKEWLLDSSSQDRGYMVSRDRAKHPTRAWAIPFLEGRTDRLIKELKHRRCPLLQDDGTCLIAPLQPLHCRVMSLPHVEAIEGIMLAIYRLVPQHSGFLPAQLYSLFQQEEYTQLVLSKQVSPAKSAMGSVKTLLGALTE